MDDTKLLELAAASYGQRIVAWNTQHGGHPVAVLDGGTFWQPLHENALTDCMGDALRLAVKMALEIRHGVGMVTAAGDCVWEEVDTANYTREEATRRAIVRAAAAMAP